LGCDFPGGDEYFDGVMDEVLLFSRALTEAEILKVMAGGGTISVNPDGKLGVTWGMIKNFVDNPTRKKTAAIPSSWLETVL